MCKRTARARCACCHADRRNEPAHSVVRQRCIALHAGAPWRRKCRRGPRPRAWKPAKSALAASVIKLAHPLHKLRQSQFRGPWYRQAGESPSLFTVTDASHAVRRSPLDEHGATRFGGLGTGRPGNPLFIRRDGCVTCSAPQPARRARRYPFRGPWYRQAGESPSLSGA